MKNQTFGSMIAALRKEKGMTQLELAEQMGVTDKAVSKWERDLSFPDVSSIPTLAEILGVSVDALMLVNAGTKENAPSGKKAAEIAQLALKGVALAMGIAVTALSLMNRIEADPAVRLLGIGLACLAVTQLSPKGE